ncbi:hypothetical protein T492DRAFT_1092759 [Pavlovales sp. CCMP2436]|nr:hypothetical protein T492DRAFT_1092759 [Pavlovales sp. CCMP2436]
MTYLFTIALPLPLAFARRWPLSPDCCRCSNSSDAMRTKVGWLISLLLLSSLYFNVPRFAVRRRTGMTWEGQRML